MPAIHHIASTRFFQGPRAQYNIRSRSPHILFRFIHQLIRGFFDLLVSYHQ